MSDRVPSTRSSGCAAPPPGSLRSPAGGRATKLLESAAAPGIRDLETPSRRPEAADPQAVARPREALQAGLPQRGEDPESPLERLDALGSPASAASAGPRDIGFVTGGTLPAALAAGWPMAAWDPNGWERPAA